MTAAVVPASPPPLHSFFFWATVVAIPAATAAVIVVLSRTLADGQLAEVSVVFGLSLIFTVLPIAAQARASADAAAGGEPARIPWVPLIVATVVLVGLAWPFAAVLDVGLAATFFSALGLIPSVGAAVSRGNLIGRGRLVAAGVNNGAEALVRLACGVGLGLAIGADGVAFSLFLAAAVSWLVAPRFTPSANRLRLPAAFAATAFLICAVQVDTVLAPRILGADADAYVTAALPSKGIYVALAAIAWVLMPATIDRRAFRDLLNPVLGVVALGGVLAVGMAVGISAIGALLGRDAPRAPWCSSWGWGWHSPVRAGWCCRCGWLAEGDGCGSHRCSDWS